jgi:hypothetical protein
MLGREGEVYEGVWRLLWDRCPAMDCYNEMNV